ncbi:serine/threonine-protein kinase fused isoform X2 [Anthonomus grandis grandis]|uniref:serine/threonine-protein kinase fused isoform X2 n=1 Tax=Anthonomus grandis grandis TaxID=2921223 RepID=UPI002165FCE2|nr:serine/threonine-protein kinase fused isoform X2 [Anthonomus grandis grandis]
MEKYEVIGTLGEGSFGRVYKAKELSSSNFVALKVISKRGRSSKELKGFRRECEIQRELHHPNVIQMLDSFETENEIVVITEFAPKELTDVLSKQGYLTEDKVKQIVWDLVSALYYLHSNRVLHRDLKPQNILLDLKNRAKLCDFGFARNMSTGTHVLTSIKGTPLYMAPELIDELPYDYNADLWSLGCIIYELLMGTPPFCTNSILHLIRKIKTEQIKWPTFLSPECTSFLKGLLQKNPSKRLTWNQILNHSFVKGHILISKTTGPMPLTISLSASAQEAKEQQRKDSINNKHTNKGAIPRTAKKSVEVPENEKHSREKVKEEKATLSNNKNNSLDTGQNPTGAIPKKPLTSQEQISSKEKPLEVFTEGKSHRDENGNVNEEIKKCDEVKDVGLKEKLNFIEDSHPIEPEEWIVFLQNSIKEVMNGEMSSLVQPNLTNIIVSPLRNTYSNSKVLSYVAKLLSIAFVVKGTSKETIENIKKVYLEVKLLPNLIYATKLLLRTRKHLSSSESSNSSSEGVIAPSRNDFTCKSLNEFDSDELQALEHILMLACHLVHLEDEFVSQFCDAVVVLNMFGSINLLLGLVKRKPRIPMDIISILTQILRNLPENVEIVEKIALHHTDSGSELHLGEFLRNSDASIKERTCHFILLMGKYFSHDTLEKIWSLEIQDTLEALMFDSVEHVRNMELPHTTLWQFDIGLMNTFQGCGLAGVVQLNDPTTRFLPLT